MSASTAAMLSAPATFRRARPCLSVDGFLAGGTIGANYQWGQFVLGVEGDGDWTNLDGTTPHQLRVIAKSRAIGSPRRASASAMHSIGSWSTGRAAALSAMCKVAQSGDRSTPATQVGWTGGGGVEFAFTPNFTAKVEYLYVDLGNFTCTFYCAGGGYS